MSEAVGQQHPIGIYLKIWILLFVLSTFSYMVDYFELQGYLRWSLILFFMFLKAGYIIADDAPKTIADGLLVPLKERTWHFVSTHVTNILTASEAEIIEAMKLTWKHLRIVMEPSSAVPLATILKNKERFAGKRVGVIITGGNVDLDKLPWTQGA